jgi:phosphoglycerol transferase MdoB-like AlkP superfamily enzyme
MLISDPFVHAFTPKRFSVLDPGHFIIDILAWLAFFAIALRAQRFWILCVSSLQTISLIAHVAKLLDYSVHPTAYGIMQVASSWPLLILLIIGTFNHRARLQQNGKDPSWKT